MLMLGGLIATEEFGFSLQQFQQQFTVSAVPLIFGVGDSFGDLEFEPVDGLGVGFDDRLPIRIPLLKLRSLDLFYGGETDTGCLSYIRGAITHCSEFDDLIPDAVPVPGVGISYCQIAHKEYLLTAGKLTEVFRFTCFAGSHSLFKRSIGT